MLKKISVKKENKLNPKYGVDFIFFKTTRC